MLNFRKKELVNTLVYPRVSHSLTTPEYKLCTTGYLDDKIYWLKSIGIL